MVQKDADLKRLGAGRIDSNHLQTLLNMQGNVAVPISGKVINVAHQIPFDCVLSRSPMDDLSTVDHLRVFAAARRGRENSVASNSSGNSSSIDSAPISHLAKRRSTLPALGESPYWKLSQRRGHSAMYAGIDSLKQNYRTLYVGSTGNIVSTVKDHIPAEQVTEEERESLCNLLMSKHDVVPLFIEDQLAHGHYEGYCKQVLWPVLHYIMWAECLDEGKFWEAYVAVNRIFANKIAEVYEKGDLVFVHDYHLLLVPSMLREMIPEARIGLFVHTPFVSSEIFRCLPRRRDLLLGMLGANLVSFQTYNYARLFASNCVRILGFEYTPNGVDANGNIVSLGIHPIGIDVDRTRKNCMSPGVEPKMRAMREKYKGKKIIVGRDKLDPVKGVLQKLDSFEKFLQDYPEWRDKVVLIQVTSPGVVGSPRLDTKMAEAVNRINSKFGSLEFSPVQLFHQHIDRDEYYALLTVADALLVTSTADGMNTTSLEFIVAQERGNNAPLILSEFTGTARSLSAALIVNPYDYADVAAAIDESLTMSDDDKHEKFMQMSNFVNNHTVSYWANSLIKDLVASAAQESCWGPSPKLEVDRLKIEYKESNKRLLFFDYDGTLVPICEKPEDAAPSKETVQVLEKLCADPDNMVWVVSGRDQATLEKWLGHIPRLGLSSEHGCYIKDPGKDKLISMIEQLDMSWKEDVLEIFKYYTERTPGSFIEQKRCALTWHYRTADPKFGAFQAKECQNHLNQSVISKLPVETLVGKKALEVRPQVINKGEVIRRALTQHPDASFILCAGDDKTDEDMFRVLANLKIGGIIQILFTISVGPAEKRTIASWHVESNQKFNQVLKELTTIQQKESQVRVKKKAAHTCNSVYGNMIV